MIHILIDREKVREAKEKLGEETFRVMMGALGVTEYDWRNQKNLCLFHEEKTPSFVWNSRANQMHCFGACHRSYGILDVFMHMGLTYLEAVQKLFDLTHTAYSFGKWKMHTRAQYRYPKEPPNGDKSKVCAYLQLRRISQKTADYLDIRQDEHGNLAFLYYDANDTLTIVVSQPSDRSGGGTGVERMVLLGRTAKHHVFCELFMPKTDFPLLYLQNIQKISFKNS